jgi:hypothetical protein
MNSLMARPIEYSGKIQKFKNEIQVKVNYEDDFKVKLTLAKKNVIEALTMLEAALPSENLFNKTRIMKMIREFKKSHITWNNEFKKYRFCSEDALAYAIPSLGRNVPRIVICPDLYLQSEAILTQVLIHEAAHTVFPGKECAASIIEVFALEFSNINYPIKSGYWDRCKLDKVLERARRL